MRKPMWLLRLGVLGAAAVLLAARAGDENVPSAHAQGMVVQTAEYGCSGRPEPFSVPPGVTQLTIEAEGAAGNASSGAAGRGGTVRATLPVAPNDLLTIEVGCRNGYGFVPGAGGGDSAIKAGANGGGATGIRDGLRHVLPRELSTILVAGGGGGGGGHAFFIPIAGGDGGNAAAPVAGAAGAGEAGDGFTGGAGGGAPPMSCEAGAGQQGGFGTESGGGGGGGGGGFWYVEPTFGCGGGGGGGRGDAGGGGGGGLSYASDRLTGVAMGVADGLRDGKVTIRFTGPAGSTPQRFACTGSPAAYTVPAGVSGVAALAAGGNGGGGASRIGANGGAGAGLVAFLTTPPGGMFELAVGCPGGRGESRGVLDVATVIPGGAGGFGYYPGGAGGTGDKWPLSGSGEGGGGGGGASGIAEQRGSLLLLAAGGGGDGGRGFYGQAGTGGAANTGSGANGEGNGADLGGALGGSSPQRGMNGTGAGTATQAGGGGGGGGGIKDGAGGLGGGLGGGGGGGGGGGLDFALTDEGLVYGVSPVGNARSTIEIYPIWGLRACGTPTLSSRDPCYDPATASAVVP